MAIELTFWEKFNVKLGKKYLLNINTMEVHDLLNKHSNCAIRYMAAKNKVYLSERQFQKVLKDGWNGKKVDGCRWCLKKHDTG